MNPNERNFHEKRSAAMGRPAQPVASAATHAALTLALLWDPSQRAQ
jgi:hypothetical protein